MDPRVGASIVVAAALVLAPLAAAALGGSAPASAAAAGPAAATVVIELARALAWPVVVLVAAAVFRRPLADFVTAIGGRASKVSAFNVSIELASASVVTTPLLNDIRAVTSSAQISDSSSMMLEQAQSTEPADFAVIALGDGTDWLTSRLFIAAVMMERMRGVRVFVFVGPGTGVGGRFIAVAGGRQLRWALARRFPWLEAAAIQSEFPIFAGDAARTSTTTRVVTDSGALGPASARQIVAAFIAAVQRPPIDPIVPPGWVRLKTADERAEWVTRDLLATLLPPDAFRARADEMPNASRARRARALLRCRAPFVALVDGNGDFVRLVDRLAYLEDVAASLGDEPDG